MILVGVDMTQSGSTLIKGGRVIDPANGVDEVADVLIVDGKVAEVGKVKTSAVETLDAKGMIVCPGLVDIHVHLRQPGGEAAETIASGAAAAVNGGFTSVAAMPNTAPPIDNEALVTYVRHEGERAGGARVFCVGAITQGRAGGELAQMGGMVRAGAVAFSDDGSWVADGDVMRRALEYARTFDKPVITHAEDGTLSGKGVMHEGAVSTALGLAGIPSASEESAVFRDIALAELTDSRLHVAHVSTAGSVELVRRAKARGVKVTAEVAIHHLTLTDEAVRSFETVFKVNPPLRTSADVDAVREGLADGTIDCIVSDHAPHSVEAKSLAFDEAPFGMIGLESTLPVLLTELVATGILSWSRAIEAMTIGPARALGLPVGTLAPGAQADVTVIDPDVDWTLDAGDFKSLSRNCPYHGARVRGRATAVFVDGLRRK